MDKEGLTKGQHLRVRVKVSVFELLVCGFYLKTSLEDMDRTWFDFSYEKVPHFCCECGRLVHPDGIYVP